MEVRLYRCADSEEVVNKEIQLMVTVTGDVREEIELFENLVIRVEVNTLSNANYAYIDFYERYFFITKSDSICEGIYDLHLQSDVLMSFTEYFEEWEGIVKRQENKYNLLLNDNSFKIYQNPIVIQKTFPNGFSGQEYVLLCGGIPIEVE